MGVFSRRSRAFERSCGTRGVRERGMRGVAMWRRWRRACAAQARGICARDGDGGDARAAGRAAGMRAISRARSEGGARARGRQGRG